MMQLKTLLSVLAFLVLLAVLLLAALTASADKGEPPVVLHNSLSVTGANPPPIGGFSAGPIQRPAALINDGSFENGPPPGSAWIETSSTGCEWIGDWRGVWGGVAARDGSQDYWGGGYCGSTPTTSSVRQSGILVPGSGNVLRFWIVSYRPDPDDAQLDQAYLQVNGTTVWTYNLIQANDTYPNWVEKSVSLAAYAGQYVTLKFGANSAGDATGNIRFDYITILDNTPPVVHWVAPVSNGQVYTVSGGTVELEASATDNVGVQRVDFVRWDHSSQVWVSIGTDYSPPYQAGLNVSTLNMDWNQVNATAFDNDGNWATEYIWINRIEGITPTPTRTRTPTSTVTPTRTPTSTATNTRTPTATPPRTATSTPSSTPTATRTGAPTATACPGCGLASSAWPMFHHDLQHTGRSPNRGPTQPELKWSSSLGGGSSPAIGSDGTLYVGLGSRLYALNPDGSVRWSYAAGDQVKSPLVAADGTVYAGSGDGKLYAINSNGTLKWTYTTGGWISASPAIGSDGTIYIGSADGNLYALNPNGSLKWSYFVGSWMNSSPAIGAGGIIYFGSTTASVYALNPVGTLRWSYRTGSYVDSAPSIAANGTIYLGSVDKKVYAFNPDGTVKWTYTTGGAVGASPAVAADGTIYVGSGDMKIYALRPDGSLKWSYTTGGSIVSSAAIGFDGVIYIGSEDGNLYAFNPNGDLRWSVFLEGRLNHGPALNADSTIYIGRDDAFFAVGQASTPTPTPTPAPTPVHRFLPLVARQQPPTPTPTSTTPPIPAVPALNPITPPEANPSYMVSWSAAAQAESYVLERATGPDFRNAAQVYAGPNTAYRVPSQGIARFYYRVQARNQSGSSPWSNVQSVDVRWELEPNNSADVANGPLSSGLDYYGFPNDTSDYFIFETSIRGQITVDLDNHTGQGIQLLLYRPAGNLVQQDIQPPYRLEYTGDPGGYYVRVYSTGGFNNTAPYTLRAVFPASANNHVIVNGGLENGPAGRDSGGSHVQPQVRTNVVCSGARSVALCVQHVLSRSVRWSVDAQR